MLNRLTAVKTSTGANIATFGYDALSRRTSLGLANGLTTSYSYDSANRLLAIAQPTVGDRTYTYDPLSNRLTLTDPAGTTTIGYDPLSQVTSLDYPAGFFAADTSYLYDGVGNRLRETVNGTPANYSPNSLNQYRQRETQTFTYDGNGNLTNDQTTTFAYDSEHRLVSASANTSRYAYDPFGRRLSNTVGGTTTRFLYDGEQLIAETDAAGAVQAKYVFGAGLDEPLRLERAGTFTYYHADGLGSIVALTDGSGAVLERYQYDAFGTTRMTDPAGAARTSSIVANRFAFTARELDAETGLYHSRARTYSPNLGRFLQRDRFADDFLQNRYTYVGNAPTTSLDPLGWWLLPAQSGPTALIHPGALVGPTLLIHPIPAPGPTNLPHPGNIVGPTILDHPVEEPGQPISDGPTKGKGNLQGMRKPGKGMLKPNVWLTNTPEGSEEEIPTRTPGHGEPGSVVEFPTPNGGKIIRIYGPDGNAIKDIHFGHEHGAGDPHIHDVDWTQPKPWQPGRPPEPGEIHE